MGAGGVWAEWLSLAMFVLSTLLCLRDMLAGREWSLRHVRRWSFRKWLHALVFVSNLARAVATFVEAAFLHSRFESNRESWVSYLLRGIPSLFFFSTFCMVILFWAQLLYVAARVRIAWLRPAFVVFNVVVYTVFVVVACTTAALHAYSKFWLVDLYFNGGVYGLGAVVSAVYAFQILPVLRRTRQDPALEELAGRNVLEQCALLLVVCTTVFLLRSVISLSVAAAFHKSHMFRKFYFDLVTFALVEFAPTLILLHVTRKRTPRDHLSVPASPNYKAAPVRVVVRVPAPSSSAEFHVFADGHSSSSSHALHT